MKIEEIFAEKIKNADKKHPLRIAYDSEHMYYKNFIKVLKRFEDVLTEKELKELIDKLHLTKEFDLPHYLQFTSEITVLYYILRKYNNDFKYEPKYNGNKNPECSFNYHDKTINIEVKCPDLSSKIEEEQNPTLKISSHERIPNEQYDNYKEVVGDIINNINLNGSDYSGIETRKRLDNKLKDYIISASEKFPKDGNCYFNILVISLDIIQDLDEWYLYIFGEGGIFTESSFVSEDYNNVDAILLTTSECGHIQWEKYCDVNVWNLEETINLLFLNPKKEKDENGKFYSTDAISIFGNLTIDFLKYLQKLDNDEAVVRKKIRNNEITKYIRFCEQKIIEGQLISEFLKYKKYIK